MSGDGRYQLRCNGLWLDFVAAWGDLNVTWRWGSGGGGLDEVTWSMQVPRNFDHPVLRNGAYVEVMNGAEPVGAALLAEPGRTDEGLSFVARGIYHQAEYVPCLTSAGDTTSRPNVAIDNAIATFGLPWTRPATISASPQVATDTTNGVNYLDTLLNSLVDELGARWWVDGTGVVSLAVDPTTPQWQLIPGMVDFGVADDDFASILIGRYINTAGTYVSTPLAIDTAARARWGTRAFVVDETPLGKISDARAASRLQGLLAHGRGRLSFTDRIEVDPNQLLTMDGRPASLSLVRGGQMVRAHGVDGDARSLNGANYVDFTIGEVVDNQDGTITIAQVDMAGRALSDRIALPPPKNLQLSA